MVSVTPSYALEQSICNYLTEAAVTSGSALSGSLFTAYTGIGNIDVLSGSCVIVNASDAREVVPFSRNYEFNTVIEVKEMAADTPEANLGVLAQAIFNEFVNSQTAAGNFSNPAYGIATWQCQTLGMIPSFHEDALVNTIQVRIIGALVPVV